MLEFVPLFIGGIAALIVPPASCSGPQRLVRIGLLGALVAVASGEVLVSTASLAIDATLAAAGFVVVTALRQGARRVA